MANIRYMPGPIDLVTEWFSEGWVDVEAWPEVEPFTIAADDPRCPPRKAGHG